MEEEIDYLDEKYVFDYLSKSVYSELFIVGLLKTKPKHELEKCGIDLKRYLKYSKLYNTKIKILIVEQIGKDTKIIISKEMLYNICSYEDIIDKDFVEYLDKILTVEETKNNYVIYFNY